MQTSALDRLKSSREEIFKNWEQAVRRNLPSAKGQDRLALRDSLPRFLEKLIQALETKDKIPTQEIAQTAQEHGEERARSPDFPVYSIDEVLSEYEILRRAVFSCMEAEAPLTSRDRDIILKVFATATSEAAARFMQVQLELERSARAELELSNLHLQEERDIREKFVDTLTHDLRTPLTSAKLGAEMLARDKEATPKIKSGSERIIKSISRAGQMIENLLDTNRLKAGEKIPLQPAALDLNSVAQRSLAGLTELFGERFVLQNNQAIKGFWDESGIERCLENLCTNAVKYGDPGRPITVTLKQIEDHVWISVHNEGKTIPPHEQASLFDQFWRSESAKASGKKGWGIGLSLVRGIIEAHYGRIGVKSAPGEGTTFSVILPVDSRKPVAVDYQKVTDEWEKFSWADLVSAKNKGLSV